MTCPRCNNEWDVSKSPCPRCGLLVHVPWRRGTRSTPPSEGDVPPTPQFPRVTQTPQSSGMSNDRQQSGGTPSINSNPAGGMRSVRPQSTSRQQSYGVPPVRRQENTVFPSQPNNSYSPITSFPSHIPPMGQHTEEEAMENSQPLLPVQPQWNQFGTPSSPSMNALPNTPRPANTSSPDYDDNPFLAQLRRDDTRSFGPSTNDIVGGANAPTRNVPHRPQVQPPINRSTDNLLSEAQRSIRPSRLTTDALAREGGRSIPSSPLPAGYGPTLPKNVAQGELPQLVPGTLLRGGRYRLRELQERQDWVEGVFEATWVAQDAQRSGSQVMISELVTPDDSKSMIMQSTLRNATMALTSVGRHSHIPTLWDAFSDQGRNFFVFEPTEGESLAARMRRTRRALPEHDVVECCLQMTEILEILVQQSPSLVHGLIRPEHIIIARTGSDYTLTNFSIVLVGGATQYVTGIDRSYLTPYTAPEFARGTIDVRSDLYSLLATAYHAVTGSLPVNAGASIPQAQRLNTTVSSAFDAILARGLHPIASQRYPRPSDLRQDLLAMRSVSGTLTTNNISHIEPQMSRVEQPVSTQTTRTTPQAPASDTLSQLLPSMMASGIEDQEQKLLLPRPEELPAMPARNDFQQSAFWLVGILLCLLVIVIVSRGFM